MTDQKDYEALAGIFENIDPTSLKFPAIPMGTYLQEGADLYAWMQPDQGKLASAGLDWSLAEGLPTRIGAARHAQSIWNSLRNIKAEAQKAYDAESPAAFDMRDTLVHDMLHAYRKTPDVLERVRKIAEGSGNADMIQDLSDLAVVGRTYPEPLEQINFDFARLETADDMVNRLSPLLGTATGEASADNEAKLNRDRAYTYLKEAVDEIRAVGRYVFWRNRARVRGYASEYVRRHRGGDAFEDIEETASDTQTQSAVS